MQEIIIMIVIIIIIIITIITLVQRQKDFSISANRRHLQSYLQLTFKTPKYKNTETIKSNVKYQSQVKIHLTYLPICL